MISHYGPVIVALPLDACVPAPDGEVYFSRTVSEPHAPVEGLFDTTAWAVKRWWQQEAETPKLFGTYYARDHHMEPRYCAHCGRAFATCDPRSPIKYCSNRCAYQARNPAIVARVVAKRSAIREAARAERSCAQCGEPINAQRGTKRFCSPRCRVAHHRAQPAATEADLQPADAP